MDLAWDGSEKLMKSVSMDCGMPVFEIRKYEEDDSEMNPMMFMSDVQDSLLSFSVLQQEMPESLGIHDFKVVAYFTDATENIIESEPFSVKISNPCIDPVITEPEFANQDYVISYESGSYSLAPLFAVTPQSCKSKLETIVPPALENHVIFDPDSQTFAFEEITDSLDLSGDTETIYTIDVIYSVLDPQTDEPLSVTERSFTLTIKNPCISEENLNFLS